MDAVEARDRALGSTTRIGWTRDQLTTADSRACSPSTVQQRISIFDPPTRDIRQGSSDLLNVGLQLADLSCLNQPVSSLWETVAADQRIHRPEQLPV